MTGGKLAGRGMGFKMGLERVLLQIGDYHVLRLPDFKHYLFIRMEEAHIPALFSKTVRTP